MKTAICISGIGRSLSHVFDNLKDNLIDCWNDRDVYYVLGKSEYTDESIKLFENISNCNLKLYDQKDIDLGNLTMKYLYSSDTNPTPQTIAKFMDKRVEIGKLLNSSNKKYDRVIVSRDDVLYSKPVSETVSTLDMEKMNIPNWGHHLGGYNDRFSISNLENQKVYLNAWNYFKEVKDFHVESFYKYYLDKYLSRNKMKTFYIEISRVRPNGNIKDERFKSQAVCNL
tara:strand:+ start:1196 stop:1876 length:681 start_codon:yes stop_codon:yes gene_type:complete